MHPPTRIPRATTFIATLTLALGSSGCSSGGSGADAAFDVTDARDDSAPADATDATHADAGPPPPPVGVITRTFVDTTRITYANGDAPEMPARSLETEIWYPAGPVDAGTAPVRNAPTDGHSHPLVVFVHGSSGTRVQSTFLTIALARAGYVVAAADFPLTALDTPGGSSDLHVDQQPGDVSFLATSLGAASMDSTDALAGEIDASHYAVVGHSTGATVALLTAWAPDAHDDRVAASVALAPCACFFGDSFFQTRALPVLIMAGTDDRFVPISTNGARAYALAGPPREMVTLTGGNHLYFTDIRLPDDGFNPMPTTLDDAISMALAQYGGGTACTPVPPPSSDPAMSIEVQHRETIDWVRAFLDATLRAQGDGLAALEAAPDGVVTVQHDGI